MSDFLFVYGTLQPGLAPAEIAPVLAQLDLIGEASVNGVLYDIGSYPGAVLAAASQEKIIGAVYKLPEDATVLAALDAYEEFDPAAPHSSLFLRVLHPIELATGGTLQCWVYVYNRDPGTRRVMPSGIFRMNAQA